MRKISLILFCLICYLSSHAQTLAPVGTIFSPNAPTGSARYGFVKGDSALIVAVRDTNFIARYPGTLILWLNAGTDTAVWVSTGAYTGKKWLKVVTITPGSGSGSVTSIATNNGTYILGGTITSTGTLSLDTTGLATRAWSTLDHVLSVQNYSDRVARMGGLSLTPIDLSNDRVLDVGGLVTTSTNIIQYGAVFSTPKNTFATGIGSKTYTIKTGIETTNGTSLDSGFAIEIGRTNILPGSSITNRMALMQREILDKVNFNTSYFGLPNLPSSSSGGTYAVLSGGLLSTRTAAQVRSDIGAGTGSGTVTSVGLTSSDIVVGGTSPITTAGTFSLTLTNVNNDIGQFNNVTLNAKGLATSATNVAYLTTAVLTAQGTANQISSTGTQNVMFNLANVATPGTYGSNTQIPIPTIDATGRVISVALTTVVSSSSGVSSLTGTANQITASALTGAITLTLSPALILPGTMSTAFAITSTSSISSSLAIATSLSVTGVATVRQFSVLGNETIAGLLTVTGASTYVGSMNGGQLNLTGTLAGANATFTGMTSTTTFGASVVSISNTLTTKSLTVTNTVSATTVLATTESISATGSSDALIVGAVTGYAGYFTNNSSSNPTGRFIQYGSSDIAQFALAGVTVASVSNGGGFVGTGATISGTVNAVAVSATTVTASSVIAIGLTVTNGARIDKFLGIGETSKYDNSQFGWSIKNAGGAFSDGTGPLNLLYGLYYNAGYKYSLNSMGAALTTASSSGDYVLYTAPSGTINTAATITERLRVAQAGVVTVQNLAGTGSRAVLADASGNLSAPVSDSTIKEDIEPIKYGIKTIMKLNPVRFKYKEGWKNYGKGWQEGLLAQEVAKVIPEAVFRTTSTGKLGIDYMQFDAIYIKAIQDVKKEKDAEIKVLTDKLILQEKRLEKLEAALKLK